MAIKDFLKSTLRLAVAIFIAFIGLTGTYAIYVYVNEAQERDAAKPFEIARNWQFDLTKELGVQVRAKTKLKSGELFVFIDVLGHPKYFSDPRNQSGTLNFEFVDNDGFKISAKSLKISDFTTVVGSAGERIGLQNQYEEYMSVDRYRQFTSLQVGWNLQMDPQPSTESQAAKQNLDHCAPNISKVERLKRLAQYGAIRETGDGIYSVGARSVHFFSYDGSLISCQ